MPACDHLVVFHRFTSRTLVLFRGCILFACLVSACRAPDDETRNRALRQLAADPTTADAAITVTVRSGVAIVGGGVASRSQEQRALAIVSKTDGIMDVISDLVLDDRVIVRAVEEALRGDITLASVPVDITCTKGVVTLRSKNTNADQRTRIVDLARNVDGVARVVDEMK